MYIIFYYYKINQFFFNYTFSDNFKQNFSFFTISSYLEAYKFLEKKFLQIFINIIKNFLKLFESIIIKKKDIWIFVSISLISKNFLKNLFKNTFVYQIYLYLYLSSFFYIFKKYEKLLKKSTYKNILLFILKIFKNNDNIILKIFNGIYLKKIKDIVLIKNLSNLGYLSFKYHLKYSSLIKHLYIYDLERREQHSTFLEIIWTIIPSLILSIIAIPSFILLYAMDGSPTYEIPITIKVIGHQWYWEYQYLNMKNEPSKFDAYMLAEGNWSLATSKKHNLNLKFLDTNTWLKLPTNTTIKFLITSVDVIHSWALPSFGIKLDAIPGRINQVFCNLKFIGFFYGQCSELCGVNHGFMPIKIQIFAEKEYDLKSYLFNNNDNFINI